MRLRIYTDGGCSGNPGPGGWAYVIIGTDVTGSPPPRRASRGVPGELFPREGHEGELIREEWGAEPETTNNRMELLAAVSALEAVTELGLAPETVILYTDSQYVQKGMTSWIATWKRNGWRTSDKKPVKNQELWLRLDELGQSFAVNWQWVRGHAGNEFNERCDQMTQDAIASLRR